MKLFLIVLCLFVAVCVVSSQGAPTTGGQTATTDDSDMAPVYPWNWGPGVGCPCMNGMGPCPRWGGWGPGGMRGWGMGPRGRGAWGWRRGFGMQGGPAWGPGNWQGWNPAQGGSNQDPLTPDNPFMPWFLYDLTPEQRTKFWKEIGDDLPPPMTYERRARILEALRKATS